MDIENSQIIDQKSGLVLILDLLALNLFNGYRWYFEDLNQPGAVGGVIRGLDAEEDKEVCHFLVADVTRDESEPVINDLSPNSIDKLHEELMIGVSEATNHSGMQVLSFEKSKLVLQNMRRYLITEYLVNDNNVIRKCVAYRTTVDEKKVIIQTNHNIAYEPLITDQLAETIDKLLFTDIPSDKEYLDQFSLDSRTLHISGFYFPEQVRGFVRGDDIVDYESTSPGLGYSVPYSAIIGKATVYIYNNGNSEIPENMLDQLNKAHFKTALNEVFLSDKNMEIVDTYTIENSKYIILCAVMSTKIDESEKHSFLYLTTINNVYIKIRLTLISYEDIIDDADNFSDSLIQYLTGTGISSSIRSTVIFDNT